MTTQADKARQFRQLHGPGDPLVLCNVWDAGSAAAVERAGAKAIATSSWAVAAAQGYEDGENMPFDAMLAVLERIVKGTQLPVTADFEGGYAADIPRIAEHARKLLGLGVIGFNFEDQVMKGPGLLPMAEQVARLRALRRTCDDLGIPAFINARTDVFLKASSAAESSALLAETLARGAAYRDAGADGLFVPGLTDPAPIRSLCEAMPLPVNIMITDRHASLAPFAQLGVARISFGPAPYIGLMAELERSA
ncbi:isocitrate lyase/PEP mutase family protein [Novosphingobium terrae]|uniref:isocitrate lyase/PEP mutase family protein n=1 Tax=Novosphingobium terrae TaxID=2726189 RepID=UPI0019801EBC|nr:isocitrate lyase/phosphoenolpyruvate mutase family protein [Novosphingobium terrae]